LSLLAPAQEGGTSLLLPDAPSERGPAKRRPVFYNRAMALDRDLAVAVLAAWGRHQGRPLRGWDMLAATGARGLRLLNESGAFAGIVLSESHPEAQAVLRQNAEPFAARGARVLPGDAREPPPDGPFDYVDLDPFGTPVPFLKAAFAALAPGGLLGVTATDMPVLAGVQPRACRARYGARSIPGYLGPEAGLRILLAYLERTARAEGRGVHVRLAYVLGHHVRAYVEVPATPAGSPAPIDELPDAAYSGPPLPPGGPYGPLWVGPLFDRPFLGEVEVPAASARPRDLGSLVHRFREEAAVDRPFFYEPNRVARSAGLPCPPSLEAIARGLRAAGFAFARAHVRASAFRTDAPPAAVIAAAGGRSQ
jgi:tRNA (guanine26-N2/guanine27-N2)-dimethyltransferase